MNANHIFTEEQIDRVAHELAMQEYHAKEGTYMTKVKQYISKYESIRKEFIEHNQSTDQKS